jgi:hypothetical protein
MHLVSFDELDPTDAALVAMDEVLRPVAMDEVLRCVAMDEVLRRVGAALAGEVGP